MTQIKSEGKMKKQITILLILFSTFSSIFAVSPNVLINGHLGEDLPPSLILKVESTIVPVNGSIIPISGNFNFSDNLSSVNVPILVYASNPGVNDARFDLTVSTGGFKKKTPSGLEGNPLDIDITLHTATSDANKVYISSGGTNTSFTFNQIIFSGNSSPANYEYVVKPAIGIDETYVDIWFTWESKLNIPAGSYGALIGFAITAI